MRHLDVLKFSEYKNLYEEGILGHTLSIITNEFNASIFQNNPVGVKTCNKIPSEVTNIEQSELQILT